MTDKLSALLLAVSSLLAGCSSNDGGVPVPMEECSKGADGECAEAAIAIDREGFFSTPTQWYARTADPALAGDVLDASTTAITASIGGRVVAQATITGARWALQLPAGAIAETGTEVVLRATTGGGDIDLRRVFVRDTSVPSLLAAGATRDERSDLIDVSTGAPVHTHVGEVVRATAGCVDVYKYAYLMDPGAPQLGSEASPNPLLWTFRPTGVGIDAGRARYRVRRQDGTQSTVLRDWSALGAVTPDGTFHVPIFRSGPDGFPSLGTTAQQVHIDVRFRDWKGVETEASVCWDHHPLAAPVELTTPVIADGAGGLAGMTFAANSPISRLANPGAGVPVFRARLRHFAAEAVALSVTRATDGVPGFSRTVAHDFGGAVAVPVQEVCPDEGCEPLPYQPSSVPTTGALPLSTLQVTIVDPITQQPLACDDGPCMLPARTGAQPIEYTVLVSVANATTLRPRATVGIGEHTIAGQTFTGEAPVAHSYCSRGRVIGGINRCLERTTVQGVIALDRLRLDVPVVGLELRTAHADQVPDPVLYLPNGRVFSPALVWDAGDDDLPGSF